VTWEAYVPRPGYSVRPPDLDEGTRWAMRADAPALVVGEPEAPVEEGGRRRRLGPGLRRIAEVPLLIVGALALAFVIKAFLVQAFYIPSGSMIPSLEVGDRVLVEKVSYRFREPQRGEVIVFQRPGAEPEGGLGPAVRSFFEGLGLVQPDEDIDLIKRVIGLPGETVEVREGTVIIDGQPLPEAYILPDGRSFPRVAVPDDLYYLLGDNRANSDDSRYSLGMVPAEEVVGRAFVILWPPRNASVSLGTDYAGVGPPARAGQPADILTPPDLP